MSREQLIDDELLNIWLGQDRHINRPEPDHVVTTLQDSYRLEERRLRNLTIQEVLPSVVVAAVFSWMGFISDQRQWALFLAAALTLAVGLFLLRFTVNQRRGQGQVETNLRAQLDESLHQLGRRAWLYRNVLWWYLAPIAIAVALVAYALGMTGPGGIVFAVGYLTFLGVLFVVNRRIGRRYQAEFDRLSDVRRGLSDG